MPRVTMDRRHARFLTRLTTRPVLSVFLLALSVRLFLAGVIAIVSDGTLFLDDQQYLETIRIGGGWKPPYADQMLASSHAVTWRKGTVFYQPILLLFRLIGPYAFVAQLLPALAGAVTAGAVAKIVGPYTSPKIALCAGLLVAIYPSQVLWSSLILRDAFSWMALSLVAVTLTCWDRREDLFGFGGYTVVLAGIAVYLGGIRASTLIVCCLALLIAVLWRATSLRIPKLAVAASLLFLVPVAVEAMGLSYGMLGTDLLRSGLSGLEDQRQAASRGAGMSLGEGDSFAAGAVINDFRHLPAGLRLVLIDPLPHEMFDKSVLVIPFIENLIWYPMLVLALLGVPEVRRGGTDLAYVILVGVGSATSWALVEGNFGTAYRHRGDFVWAVAVFAALGANRIFGNGKYPSVSDDS